MARFGFVNGWYQLVTRRGRRVDYLASNGLVDSRNHLFANGRRRVDHATLHVFGDGRDVDATRRRRLINHATLNRRVLSRNRDFARRCWGVNNLARYRFVLGWDRDFARCSRCSHDLTRYGLELSRDHDFTRARRLVDHLAGHRAVFSRNANFTGVARNVRTCDAWISGERGCICARAASRTSGGICTSGACSSSSNAAKHRRPNVTIGGDQRAAIGRKLEAFSQNRFEVDDLSRGRAVLCWDTYFTRSSLRVDHLALHHCVFRWNLNFAL